MIAFLIAAMVLAGNYFHSAVDMIINFNVDAYDFRGCICSESITNQIRQNGGLIDEVFH